MLVQHVQVLRACCMWKVGDGDIPSRPFRLPVPQYASSFFRMLTEDSVLSTKHAVHLACRLHFRCPVPETGVSATSFCAATVSCTFRRTFEQLTVSNASSWKPQGVLLLDGAVGVKRCVVVGE